MEFLKIIKRRSFINEVVYVLLNIILALTLFFIIRFTNSLIFAFALVLLSQWRIFAVRPRFWLAHIQANVVNTIVSASYVVFLYIANMSVSEDIQILSTQIILAIFFMVWLIFIKPQSKRFYIILQASLALLLGITAIYNMSYNWIASLVVLMVWVVGYSTAKHILASYDEETHAILLSIVWGLALAEISWLAYHWTIAYRLPFMTTILVPQVSIIILCVAFIAYKSYDSFYHHQRIRLNDVVLPIAFSVSIISILVIAFNSVSTGII